MGARKNGRARRAREVDKRPLRRLPNMGYSLRELRDAPYIDTFVLIFKLFFHMKVATCKVIKFSHIKVFK